MSAVHISVNFSCTLGDQLDLEIVRLNASAAAATAITTTENNNVCYHLPALRQALCRAFCLYYPILLYSSWCSILSPLNSSNENVNSNVCKQQ